MHIYVSIDDHTDANGTTTGSIYIYIYTERYVYIYIYIYFLTILPKGCPVQCTHADGTCAAGASPAHQLPLLPTRG